MKIVLNDCYGGFSISRKAAEYMAERGSLRAKRELKQYPKKDWYGFGYVDDMPNGYDRTDPLLIEAVEVLGVDSFGYCAELKVIEIPDDINYYIHEYDGMESVHENHRTWS